MFLPQMRLSFEQLIARARAAEAAGFVGIAGMDHLAPPMAEDQPMYEAMITNAWMAAHTSTLKVSSLVLCDAFRLPAMLAREAVTLDHASGGRFELGLGWGSVPTEFPTYGVGSTVPRERVDRMRETMMVLRAFWAGETLDLDGEYHQLSGARQAPTPLNKIPIIIGGTGPKTLALVRDYADWWNVHTGGLNKVAELRDKVGSARVSIQEVTAFVHQGASRDEAVAVAKKRFGYTTPFVGSGPELVDHYGQLAEQGIERVYTWFTDFSAPETLTAFGAEVIAQVG